MVIATVARALLWDLFQCQYLYYMYICIYLCIHLFYSYPHIYVYVYMDSAG